MGLCERISITAEASELNPLHERIRDAAQRFGWHTQIAEHNVDLSKHDPATAAYYGFGDQAGAKQSALLTYLQDAADGARIVVGTTVHRVLVEEGRATGIAGVWNDPETGKSATITVRARQVVVAAGSLESPALLSRSGIGGPAVGQHLHPTTGALAIYDKDLKAWWGSPQALLIDEFERTMEYGFRRRKRSSARSRRSVTDRKFGSTERPNTSPATGGFGHESIHEERGACDNLLVAQILCVVQVGCDSGDAAGPEAGAVRRRREFTFMSITTDGVQVLTTIRPAGHLRDELRRLRSTLSMDPQYTELRSLDMQSPAYSRGYRNGFREGFKQAVLHEPDSGAPVGPVGQGEYPDGFADGYVSGRHAGSPERLLVGSAKE